MRRYLFFAIILILVAAVIFFSRNKLFKASLPDYLSDVASQKYNILLITIDTLRADRPALMAQEISTPNIDGLAKDGVLFEDATSHVPLTLPSHTSIMTDSSLQIMEFMTMADFMSHHHSKQSLKF